MFWEKVRKIWSKKLIVPQNVGIEVNENGKNGRGGKAGLHGGRLGIARGEVGTARGEVGVGQGDLGDCGRFSPRGGRFAAVF